MRLSVISYVNPRVWAGGGEQVLTEYFSAAQSLGHEVELNAIWPSPILETDGSRKVDLYLIVDLYNLPGRQNRIDQRARHRFPGIMRSWQKSLDAALAGTYVHMSNAYVDICSKPYLPCQSTGRLDCQLRAQPPKCLTQRHADLHHNAALNLFVSPLHEATVRRLLTGVSFRSAVLRPSLDPTPFLSAQRPADERDIGVLFVGAMRHAKGIAEAVSQPGLVIVTPRPQSDVEIPESVEVHIGLEHSEMPGIFGRARRFFYRGHWPEPFGRTVAEAALAGCLLDVEGDIGALSFDRPPSDLRLYLGSRDEFWERLVEVAT